MYKTESCLVDQFQTIVITFICSASTSTYRTLRSFAKYSTLLEMWFNLSTFTLITHDFKMQANSRAMTSLMTIECMKSIRKFFSKNNTFHSGTKALNRSEFNNLGYFLDFVSCFILFSCLCFYRQKLFFFLSSTTKDFEVWLTLSRRSFFENNIN